MAPYGKAAAHGEQIRAGLDAKNPAMLVLDRTFETQSVDPMFLEPESGLGWYNSKGGQLELVLGVQSPYEATESIAFLLGKARAPFKPSRINTPVHLCRRRFWRARPHPVRALRRPRGDVFSRPPGPAGA